MNKGIIDVLSPYEDEVLVSWIVRMLKLYSGKERFDSHTGDIMKILFGENTTDKPGLYFQKGLQYFVDNCDLEMPGVFASEKTMIDCLSVLPFYFQFCPEKLTSLVLKRIQTESYYWRLENILGIRSRKRRCYLEQQVGFKFCPECLKECSEIYLQKEHQIQGNLVCWKHGCPLHYVPYRLEWSYLDFVYNIKHHRKERVYTLSPEECLMAKKIASIIHSIFEKGFKDDLFVLKKKLLNKLSEQGIINKKGVFYDQIKFADSLGVDFLYEKKMLCKEIGLAIGMGRVPNPVIYIVLIISLFGSLEEYYSYNELSSEVRLISKTRLVNNNFNACKKDIDYFLRKVPKKFYDEYCIFGDTENNIIIKHLKCGCVYYLSKSVPKFRPCRNCNLSMTPNLSVQENEKGSVKYQRFLTTKEYASLHGMKEQQIRNYCRDGRFAGAIRVSKGYLIPKEAPYPKDRRFNVNKEN